MLNKTPVEIFKEKVSLIYDYNRRSPLFVRKADIEIEKNNVDRAIQILIDGLKLYPRFAVAHILLGKAYTIIGSYSQAVKSYKTGTDLINSKKAYDHYLKELEGIKNQRSFFDISRRTAFYTNDLMSASADDTEITEKADGKSDVKTSVDDRLDQLAKEISTAKIGESDLNYDLENAVEKGEDEKKKIVSDTFAKILVSQGEFKEALEVYRKLIFKHPEKKDYYERKIGEIESQLDI